MARAEAKYIISAEDKTAGTLKKVSDNFKKAGQSLSNIGQQMSMKLTAPIAAFGGLALKAAGDFESSMNRVRGLTGATGQQMAALNDQAKLLGKTTSFSASQAGEAMGFLAMAGFKTGEILGAMPSTLQLAEAAQLDLARAADITSNILTGYGMEVGDLARVNDVLVKGITSANMDMEMLGESMKYAAPVASGLGVALEESVAALGMMGNAGIQASTAGTSLRKALSDMVNPTAEMAEKLKAMNLHVTNSQGKLLPMVDILKNMEKAGIGTEQVMSLFGQKAGPAMASLLKQGSRALAEMTDKLKNSQGTAANLAEIQMQGLNGAVKKLKSAFEGLQIALAESGIMQWVTGFITNLAGWISKMAGASKSTLQFGMKLAGLAAVVGPVLMIIGKLASLIGFLTSPIGWVVTAVGLLAMAWARWGDDIKKIVKPVTDWLIDKFDEVAAFVMDAVAVILNGVSWLLEKLSKLPGKIGEDMQAAADSLAGWADSLQGTADRVREADDGAGLFKDTLEGISHWSSSIMEKLKGLGTAMPEFSGNVQSANVQLELMKGEFQQTAEQMQQVMKSALGIGGSLGKVAEESKNVAGKGSKAMGILSQGARDAARQITDTLLDSIFEAENALVALGNLAKSIFKSILGGLINLGLNSLVPGLGFGAAIATRAIGGTMAAGQPYWVGDKGREIIIPSTTSLAVPEDRLISQVSSPPISIGNLNVSVAGQVSDDTLSIRHLAEKLYDEILTVSRLHGPLGAS